MSQIIYRGTVVDRKNSIIITLFAAFGIIGTVYTIIGLAAGKRAPAGMPESLPYVGIPALIFLGIAIWLYFRTRSELFITKGNGNAVGVTVVNAGRKKVIEFYSPFYIRAGWELMNMGKGKRMYHLRMAFYNDKNESLLTLETSKHAAWGKPDNWKEMQVAEFGDFKHIYGCGEVSELSKLLKAHVK